ncbi:MAG TPA: hypothetical protein VHT05_09635 [Candidatus Elarobacter sp.]|jgi:hypothetical protein|nr:hypothetical protein [Candidatus Elarobacter sp.]
MDDEQVRAHVVALEAMLQDLDESAAAVVEALLVLYGEGLRRIVAATNPFPVLANAFARDELVGHLMLLHDLHPGAGFGAVPVVQTAPGEPALISLL